MSIVKFNINSGINSEAWNNQVKLYRSKNNLEELSISMMWVLDIELNCQACRQITLPSMSSYCLEDNYL